LKHCNGWDGTDLSFFLPCFITPGSDAAALKLNNMFYFPS
jgi:hypothetical protein